MTTDASKVAWAIRAATAKLGRATQDYDSADEIIQPLLDAVRKMVAAKLLFQEKLLVTVKTGQTQIPFGMDGDEGALYLSGKADALQWVLEMLP